MNAGVFQFITAAMLLAGASAVTSRLSAGTVAGTKQWEHFSGASVTALPALGTNGLLYTVTEGLAVLALDAANGQLRWTTNLDQPVFGSAPTCQVGPDGTLYVTRSGKVQALDGESGAEKWRRPFYGVWTPAVATGPDGTVYVVADYLYALDPQTGATRWEWEGDYLSGAPVLSANGLLFVSGGRGKIIAVSTATHQRIWEASVDGYSLAPLGIGRDGTLYAGAWEGILVALDSFTGKARWQFKTNDWVVGSIVIALDGAVFAAGTDSSIRVLEPSTGQLRNGLTLPGRPESPLTLAADGTLYVGISHPGEDWLYAFDSRSGATNWSFRLGGSGLTGFNVGPDGTVYFGLWREQVGVYAVHGASPLANSAWPKPFQNAQNTSRWTVSGRPEITLPPPSRWAAVDASTTFHFHSPVLRPLDVRWRFNGQPIAGATNESFRIERVAFADAGRYSVVISNEFGATVSDEATLSVGYEIQLDTIGPGTVRRDPDLGVYPSNTVVTLTAEPAVARAFLGWGGDAAGAASSITLTMGRNFGIVASFEYLLGDVKWKSRYAGGPHALGTNGLLYTPTMRDSLMALDQTSGRPVWETGLSANVESPPAVGLDGTVYIGDYGGNLWALDGQTGATKWVFNFPGVCLHTCPAFGIDGTLYLTGNRLCAVDPKTGRAIWSFDGANGVSPVIGADGTIYGCGSEGLVAFDGLTRHQKWTFPQGASPPALGEDGTVYIGCRDDKLCALNAATGTKRWEAELVTNPYTSPIIGPDGTVYLYSPDANVYAFDAQTGQEKWRFFTGETAASTPALATDGTLYIACYDRNLYALDAASGTEKWRLLLDQADYGEGGPVIGPDGTIYVAGYALHATSPLAASAWPKYRRTVDNRGRVPLRPVLDPAASQFTADGFEIVTHGEPGELVSLEWSSDFITWTPFASATNLMGTLRVLDADSESSGVSSRFYRARNVE